MFSRRFKWDLQPNQFARLLEQKRQAGALLFDLTESNPTRAGLNYPETEILSALAQPAALRYEPAPRGLLVARAAVAGYYAERGYAVNPEHIHLTASTSEAYSFLFKLLCNQGDNVLMAQPSYPLFDFLATLEGVALKPFQLEYLHPHGWRMDFNSLIAAIDERTRAIILVNPNNPAGSYVKHAELAELNALCQRHNLALIADEVFSDYAWNEDATRVASLVENEAALTFVMSGFSKILALPQMKLGWIVTNGPVALREAARERLDLIADTFLSVAAPVQHAAATWLGLRAVLQADIVRRTQDNLRWLQQQTRDTACRVLQVESGWYATLEVPRLLSEEDLVLRLLAEEHVVVHPGYFFDFAREAYLVVSLLTEPATFQTGIQRMLEGLH
jgi:hypothetical protein